MPIVLHVGCGPKTIRSMPAFFQDGTWTEIRLDIDSAVKPDVVGTMTDLSAVASGSVDAVFSSHNIEHLYPHEVPVALKEFLRVLSPAGFTLITCPDLQSIAHLVAEDRLMEPAYQSGMGPISPIDMLYGHRASIANGNHFMAHRGGFTIRSLVDSLRLAGFQRSLGLRRPGAFELWAMGTVDDSRPESDAVELARRLFPSN